MAEGSESRSGDGAAEDSPGRIATGLVWLFVAAAFVGTAWLIYLAWPGKLPSNADANWINNIFDNKPVLFVTRLVLFTLGIVVVTGCVFTIVSIYHRFQNKHWLRRIGPFEVSEQAVSELTAQIDHWRDLATAAQKDLEELKNELQETQALADHFYDRWQAASGDG